MGPSSFPPAPPPPLELDEAPPVDELEAPPVDELDEPPVDELDVVALELTCEPPRHRSHLAWGSWRCNPGAGSEKGGAAGTDASSWSLEEERVSPRSGVAQGAVPHTTD